jgi:hypothetical protein
VKSTEKTTTSIKLRLDRFIGELLREPPRQAKAHLISVIGGDTQIAAISAAISMGDRFMVEGPGVPPVRVCLERNAQCSKGSVQVNGRKKPLRHLIGLSEEFASSNSSMNTGRTLLAAADSQFGLRSTSVNACRTRRKLFSVSGVQMMFEQTAYSHTKMAPPPARFANKSRKRE